MVEQDKRAMNSLYAQQAALVYGTLNAQQENSVAMIVPGLSAHLRANGLYVGQGVEAQDKTSELTTRKLSNWRKTGKEIHSGA